MRTIKTQGKHKYMILLSATDIGNADRFCTEFRHRERSKSVTFLRPYELNIRLISCQFTYDVENKKFCQKYTQRGLPTKLTSRANPHFAMT